VPQTSTPNRHATETAGSPAQTNRVFAGFPVAPATPPDLNPDELPLFDPDEGTTVVEPLGEGAGWWAGAPSVFWDGERYAMVYRLRRPRPERGGETRIAVSTDGVRFETVWTARKEDFGTSSIERSALLRTDDGRWRLYVSYVDGADDRWRIDLLEADAPDAFDPSTRIPVLTAADIGAEGVKDPWVCRVGDQWQLLASYAPTPPPTDADAKGMHGTKDVYNTGLTKSLTGLATSPDGRDWQWQGAVFEPRDGAWDAYAARLNTLVWRAPVWVGFYDGSASVAENYEERCGAATSTDLRTWHRLSPDGPIVGAAQGPGSVRYLEAVQGPDWVRYYYEYTRPDGSHELRTSLVAP
jgi:hypothetical protein